MALVATLAARRSGLTIWSAYVADGASKVRTPRALSAALRSVSTLIHSIFKRTHNAPQRLQGVTGEFFGSAVVWPSRFALRTALMLEGVECREQCCACRDSRTSRIS
jgi:hypothetical protein